MTTHGLKRINSYEQAAAHWASAKPWRNQNSLNRQLDTRRAFHKHLRKLSTEEAYQCVLYRTAMITYYANGCVALRCHSSRSSHAFARALSPLGCQPVSKSNIMFWKVRCDDGENYYTSNSNALMLTPTAAGNWVLTSVPDLVKEKAYNAKLGAQVRKLIKSYTDWWTIKKRLQGDCVQRVFRASHISAVVDQLNDVSTYHEIISPPIILKEQLYEYLGATYNKPVPSWRLPVRMT